MSPDEQTSYLHPISGSRCRHFAAAEHGPACAAWRGCRPCLLHAYRSARGCGGRRRAVGRSDDRAPRCPDRRRTCVVHGCSDRPGSCAHGRALRPEQRQVLAGLVRGPPLAVKDVISVAPHPQFSPLPRLTISGTREARHSPGPESNARAVQRSACAARVGDRFIVAGFGVGVQGDRRPQASCARQRWLDHRPSSQQLSLIDPQKLGEAAGLGV